MNEEEEKQYVVFGFTSKGEFYKPVKIESQADFVETFGEPDPKSELQVYLYKTVLGLLNNNHPVTVIRVKRVSAIYKAVAEGFDVSEHLLAIEPCTFEPILWNDLSVNEQIAFRGMDGATFGPAFDMEVLFNLAKEFPEGNKTNNGRIAAGTALDVLVDERAREKHKNTEE